MLEVAVAKAGQAAEAAEEDLHKMELLILAEAVEAETHQQALTQEVQV
jgi:hypothetical protein